MKEFHTYRYISDTLFMEKDIRSSDGGWRYIYTIRGKKDGKGHLIRFEKHKQVRIEREKKKFEGV